MTKMIFSDIAIIKKALAWIQDKEWFRPLKTELRSKWVVDYSLLNEDLQGFNQSVEKNQVNFHSGQK